MEGTIFAEVKAQAIRLGLPIDFYEKLLAEDDWSFVIKLNALVEAACTDALVARFHAPELAEGLASLDLGHQRHGKVKLLTTSGALEKEQAKVLQLLYELRNKLAHDVRQVSFSFSAHLAAMGAAKKIAFIKCAGHGVKPEVMGVDRDTFVAENPKLSLWITVSEVLACLHLEHDAARTRLGAGAETPSATR